jgi:hypothetical protein
MEVAQVRRRVQAALAAARERSQQRRQQVAEAESRYDRFLTEVAVPLARQVANVLKAEGRTFTVSTPGRAVRMETDRGRDDYVEIALNTDLDPPAILAHIRHTRGSRTIDEERTLKDGAAADQISEDDLLEFILRALEPGIER